LPKHPLKEFIGQLIEIGVLKQIQLNQKLAKGTIETAHTHGGIW